MIVAWYGRYGLLLGLPFGAALAVAGRNRRASELSLPRTLTCAFLACALVEGLRMVATLSFGLATSLSWALAACIDAAIVTVLWFLAMRGGARALALLGPRA